MPNQENYRTTNMIKRCWYYMSVIDWLYSLLLILYGIGAMIIATEIELRVSNDDVTSLGGFLLQVLRAVIIPDDDLHFWSWIRRPGGPYERDFWLIGIMATIPGVIHMRACTKLGAACYNMLKYPTASIKMCQTWMASSFLLVGVSAVAIITDFSLAHVVTAECVILLLTVVIRVFVMRIVAAFIFILRIIVEQQSPPEEAPNNASSSDEE